MDHHVTLERLPDGLRFPSEFDGRIRFDPVGRKLTFCGFMSKADFDRLCQLSDDWAFRRRLEELFRLCTPEEEPRPRGVRGVLAALSSLF